MRKLERHQDGTILNASTSISDRNKATVRRLLDETDVMFVPATGKSRAGALRSMAELGDYLNEIHPGGCPGVYLQGLIVFGENGNVVYEDKCNDSLSKATCEIAKELDLSLIAYSRDNILCEKTDNFVDLLPSYKVRAIPVTGLERTTIHIANFPCIAMQLLAI